MKVKPWPLLLTTLVLLAPLVAGCQAGETASAQALPETADLRREVQLLNLINGLELTDEQMNFILERARQAQETRESLLDQAADEEMQAVLQQMHDALMVGENVPSEIRDQFLAAKAENESLLEAYQQEVARWASEIEDVLEEHQVYALQSYVPCVLPPEGESRIGQAQTARGGAMLERLRTVPDDRFARHLLDPAIIPLLEEKLAYASSRR